MARHTDPALIYRGLRCAADAHIEGEHEVLTNLGFSMDEACRLADCADQALGHLSRVRTPFLTLSVCASSVDMLLDHLEGRRKDRSASFVLAAARSTPPALVSSLLRHVSQRLATGQLAALLALGFDAGQLARLATLTVRDLHLLPTVPVPVLRATVDHGRLQRLLERLECGRHEDARIAALIHLGAPRGMMRALFGLSNREFHLRRRLSGCRQKVGRPPVPTEAQSGRIWQSWLAHRRLGLSERYLATARATGLSLNLIWPLTEAWKVEEGLKTRLERNAIHAARDRLRLSC
jgi:hypothetical protein